MDSFYDTIARYYDPENDDVVDDLALYSELADGITGPILDVGCGTGRVTFHLATEGHQLHGIDRSPEMLARARRKQAQRPDLRERCTLIEGDILTDPLPARYGLILLPYNTFMHLHAEGEQQQTLNRLAQALTEDGRLVIDVPNAGEAFAAEHDGALTLERTFTEPETGHLVMQQAVTRLDRTEQLQYISWIYDEIDAKNVVHRTVAPLILRYVFSREMDLMLAAASLRRIDRYGDYDQSPFEDGCARMIVVAGRA